MPVRFLRWHDASDCEHVRVEVKVDIVPASPPSASLRARIDDIEYQRSSSEKEDIFESAWAFSSLGYWVHSGRVGWPLRVEARAEAKALSDFVVNEFEVQLGACALASGAVKLGVACCWCQVQIQRHVNNIVGARASSFLQKSAGLLPPQALFSLAHALASIMVACGRGGQHASPLGIKGGLEHHRDRRPHFGKGGCDEAATCLAGERSRCANNWGLPHCGDHGAGPGGETRFESKFGCACAGSLVLVSCWGAGAI